MIWNNKHIFEPSGCLTREAFAGLVNDQLPSEQKQIAEAHLASCPFCADAMEGFISTPPGTDFATIMAQTDGSFSKKFHKKKDSRTNIVWLSVSIAASILLLVGLFFMIQQQPEPKFQIAQQIDRDTVFPAIKATEKKKERTEVREIPEKKVLKKNIPVTKPESQPAVPVKEEELKKEELRSMQADISTPPPAEASEEIVLDEPANPVSRSSSIASSQNKILSGFYKDENKKTELYRDTILTPPIKYRQTSTTINSNKFRNTSSTPSDDEEELLELRDRETKKDLNKPQKFTDKMPEYPGDSNAMIQFLGQHLVYPQAALEKKIHGKVITQFIVRKDGSLSDFKILRGIGGGCDEEAIRVLKLMPNWKPGKTNGKEVDVYFTLPITFTLPNKR